MRKALKYVVLLLCMSLISQGEEWEWRGEPSVEQYAEAARKEGFNVALARGKFESVEVILRDPNNAILIQWQGHRYSSFIIRNGTLFQSIYDPLAYGVELRAVDIATGRVHWDKNLPQLLPGFQSKYSNRVNMEFANGIIKIYSKQSFLGGRFWWLVKADKSEVIESHHTER
jgi:hypothetical protein